MKKLNRDAMNMANPQAVSEATMTTLDRIQDYRPEIAMMAAAVVFLELAELLDVPPQEVFTATKNMLWDDQSRAKRPEFAAVSAFMKGEWNL